MNEAAWALILANLDEALDKRQPEERVGVLAGWELYGELRRRGLLVTKIADLVLWEWLVPSYRGFFVYDSPLLGATEFKIGGKDA